MMKCPKCGFEMERLEYEKAGQESIRRDVIRLRFICNQCGIFITRAYMRFG